MSATVREPTRTNALVINPETTNSLDDDNVNIDSSSVTKINNPEISAKNDVQTTDINITVDKQKSPNAEKVKLPEDQRFADMQKIESNNSVDDLQVSETDNVNVSDKETLLKRSNDSQKPESNDLEENIQVLEPSLKPLTDLQEKKDINPEDDTQVSDGELSITESLAEEISKIFNVKSRSDNDETKPPHNVHDRPDDENIPTLPKPHPSPEEGTDFNIYQHRKTLSQGMMDLALFSANANQLRYVLDNNNHPYFYPGAILISLSLIVQVAVGIGLIWNSKYDVKDKDNLNKANKVNNFTVFGIFLVTVVNVFISAFAVVPGNRAAVVVPATTNGP